MKPEWFEDKPLRFQAVALEHKEPVTSVVGFPQPVQEEVEKLGLSTEQGLAAFVVAVLLTVLGLWKKYSTTSKDATFDRTQSEFVTNLNNRLKELEAENHTMRERWTDAREKVATVSQQLVGCMEDLARLEKEIATLSEENRAIAHSCQNLKQDVIMLPGIPEALRAKIMTSKYGLYGDDEKVKV